MPSLRYLITRSEAALPEKREAALKSASPNLAISPRARIARSISRPRERSLVEIVEADGQSGPPKKEVHWPHGRQFWADCSRARLADRPSSLGVCSICSSVGESVASPTIIAHPRLGGDIERDFLRADVVSAALALFDWAGQERWAASAS